MYEQSSTENSHLAIYIYIHTYIHEYILNYKCNAPIGVAQVQGSSPLNEICQLPIYLYKYIFQHSIYNVFSTYITHLYAFASCLHQFVIQS